MSKPRQKRFIRVPKPFKKPDYKSYYIKVTGVDGKRKEVNLGTSDKKEARLRAKREVDFINSQLDGTFARVASYTELTKEYFVDKSNVLRVSTLLRNKQHMKFFHEFMLLTYPQVKYLTEITPYHISDFQNYRRETKVNGREIAPKTVKESIGILNNLFEWALKRNYVHANPVTKVEKIKVTLKEQHRFSDEEMILIIEFCKNSSKHRHLYVPFLTLATTGMRSGELANLVWNDIDFERGFIKICPKVLPDGREWVPKIKQRRDLIMDDEVQTAMAELKSNSSSEWVFVNSKGRRLKEYALWENLKSICKRLDIPQGQVHSFRRSFACQMDRAVKDRVVIQQILGHTTITMTDRYCNCRPKEFVDKAHLRTTAEFIQKLKSVQNGDV